MKSTLILRRTLSTVVLTTMLLAILVIPAGARDLPPAATNATRCGADIMFDLGTVLPAGWSDLQIVNCDEFAAPLSLSVVAGALAGWTDAGSGLSAQVAHATLPGWRDSGAILPAQAMFVALTASSKAGFMHPLPASYLISSDSTDWADAGAGRLFESTQAGWHDAGAGVR